MQYFWWGCRGNLTLITLGIERGNRALYDRLDGCSTLIRSHAAHHQTNVASQPRSTGGHWCVMADISSQSPIFSPWTRDPGRLALRTSPAGPPASPPWAGRRPCWRRRPAPSRGCCPARAQQESYSLHEQRGINYIGDKTYRSLCIHHLQPVGITQVIHI